MTRLKSGWTERLLRSVAPEIDVDAMLGDLAEERAARRRRAPRSSFAVWYYGQVVRSVPDLLWASVTGRGCAATWGAALLLYIAAAAAQVVLNAALSKVLEPGYWLAGITLALGASTLAIAGYAAARIRPRAAPALAATVAFVLVVLMAIAEDGTSPSFKIALILGPSSVLAGSAGFVSARREA